MCNAWCTVAWFSNLPSACLYGCGCLGGRAANSTFSFVLYSGIALTSACAVPLSPPRPMSAISFAPLACLRPCPCAALYFSTECCGPQNAPAWEPLRSAGIGSPACRLPNDCTMTGPLGCAPARGGVAASACHTSSRALVADATPVVTQPSLQNALRFEVHRRTQQARLLARLGVFSSRRCATQAGRGVPIPRSVNGGSLSPLVAVVVVGPRRGQNSGVAVPLREQVRPLLGLFEQCRARTWSWSRLRHVAWAGLRPIAAVARQRPFTSSLMARSSQPMLALPQLESFGPLFG